MKLEFRFRRGPPGDLAAGRRGAFAHCLSMRRGGFFWQMKPSAGGCFAFSKSERDGLTSFFELGILMNFYDTRIVEVETDGYADAYAT